MARVRLIYFLLLIGACAWIIFYWDYIAFVGLIFLAALPLLLFLLTAITAPFVRAGFLQSGVAAVRGQNGKITIRLQNRCIFPVPCAKLVLSMRNQMTGDRTREILLFPVGARNTVTLEAGVCAEHCGAVEIRLEKLVLYDFLRLTAMPLWRGGKKTDRLCRLAVLPAVFPLFEAGQVMPAEDPESPRYHPNRRGDDTSQVFDTHEYREGDRMKDIHWKLSGKLGRLMVKEFSLPVSNRVRIALELGGAARQPERLDTALDVCAAISEWLSRQQVTHEICWYSEQECCPQRILVEHDGDFEAALERMYSTPPPAFPHLLDELVREGKTDCADFIYISAGGDRDKWAQLARMAERLRVTACLYPPKNSEEGMDNLFTDAENLSLYWLNDGDAEANLHSFSL